MPTTPSRRQFIGGAVALGSASVIAAAFRSLSGTPTSTGSAVLATPSTIPSPTLAPLITPVKDFYRIDTAFEIPQVNPTTWSLRISGMVDKEKRFTLDDINAMPQVTHDITMGCVSNEVGGDLIGTAQWSGVLLADVLRSCGVQSGAEQLVSRSVDGWTCGTPVDAIMDGRPAMLVTSMNGEPLIPKHGFPVRMVVPGLFGYVSATKWVQDIELTTWNAFDAYWIDRGWAKQGPMLSSSRIDLPRNGAQIKTPSVIIAGFAWAPRAGVKSVDVRVDDGQWIPAEVKKSPTGDTWCQWKLNWTVTPGQHKFTTRVIDATGAIQDEQVRPVEPSGATGYHSISVECVA
ncbi:MAG: hypothetical protein EXQ63_02175 [Ilumatobacteraceae bacterium]|nr:hypothetical protein [Ilumatobacteraceae bacterium]